MDSRVSISMIRLIGLSVASKKAELFSMPLNGKMLNRQFGQVQLLLSAEAYSISVVE
jgi:hypothetical protein